MAKAMIVAVKGGEISKVLSTRDFYNREEAYYFCAGYNEAMSNARKHSSCAVVLDEGQTPEEYIRYHNGRSEWLLKMDPIGEAMESHRP